ncbi:unnamed protein product [Prunus armeniaca]|uniref:Uncharacterized protein n=1 Tax=Prunus armeniaca TaxID=36596 RepID=A0A6J5UNF7_PRUAR|nr:unnamed protein product [Prunus armeniaca]CAB4307119.1 unnamed protein product [Prunus armeniaca]
MGTSWSQDEANNSQSQPSEQPSNNKAVEQATEAKAAPSGSKPMAVEKTAPDHQAKLSANNSNHEITVVKEVKEMEKKTATQQVKQQLPHNYEAIVGHADSTINKSSVENLLEQLHAGITLNQKRKRYWVDKKSNNCFMVYARDLLITWAEDNRYWLWPSLQETSGVVIDAAELINVCWLEVHGKFETSKLSPGTLYEVVFVVKLKASGYGWDVPVNVRLTLPDDSIQWHKVNLMEIPREQWIEISVGEFRASPEKPGDMEFSMYEYDGGKWKRGLVIKGVTIRPKN